MDLREAMELSELRPCMYRGCVFSNDVCLYCERSISLETPRLPIDIEGEKSKHD